MLITIPFGIIKLFIMTSYQNLHHKKKQKGDSIK